MMWGIPEGWVIHWGLWVEFAKGIAWPFVALIALSQVRIGRVANLLLERSASSGLKLKVVGVDIEIPPQNQVEQLVVDTEASSATGKRSIAWQDVSLPSANSPYALVLGGWRAILNALVELADEKKIPISNWNSPKDAAEQLRDAGAITNDIYLRIVSHWGLVYTVLERRRAPFSNAVDRASAEKFYKTASVVVADIRGMRGTTT
jgi:hypothetical protein